MLTMCRESRKIFEELDKQASMYDVQGFITPAHIYICDTLVCRYYTAPILNIIKQKIKTIKNKEWKHFTIEYWSPIIERMLSHAQGTMRDADICTDTNCLDSFEYIISKYLITDYSISDAIMLNKLIHGVPYASIMYACNEARKYNVSEIRYINAIIEKERAKQDAKIQAINNLSDKIAESDKILDAGVHTHTIMDIASAQYNYEKARQNAELEKKFEEMFGNGS